MPFKLSDLRQARLAFRQFLDQNPLAHHARYIFPFFAGSYFAYRKVDVMRVVTIAKAVNENPSYVDIGCSYGDFLARVHEHLPQARGVEKEGGIFYAMQQEKPDHIQIADVESLAEPAVDVAFVGWMEPGTDFRRQVAKIARCVVTTFDAGGQCGVNGGCEYDEFGYEQIAWWRTPSWIDVNAELMNKYYTPALSEEKKLQLSKLRGAHNLWYVYARPEIAGRVREGLRMAPENAGGRYDFESVLDELGFGYMEELQGLTTAKKLWEVIY